MCYCLISTVLSSAILSCKWLKNGWQRWRISTRKCSRLDYLRSKPPGANGKTLPWNVHTKLNWIEFLWYLGTVEGSVCSVNADLILSLIWESLRLRILAVFYLWMLSICKIWFYSWHLQPKSSFRTLRWERRSIAQIWCLWLWKKEHSLIMSSVFWNLATTPLFLTNRKLSSSTLHIPVMHLVHHFPYLQCDQNPFDCVPSPRYSLLLISVFYLFFLSPLLFRLTSNLFLPSINFLF